MSSLPDFYDRRYQLKHYSRSLATNMYRQYPYNSDTHPGISANSFNILALDYIIVLNEELVEVTSAFWNHIPGGHCSIQFNFHKIPARRNYICLCAVNTDHHNRLFLAEDKRPSRNDPTVHPNNASCEASGK